MVNDALREMEERGISPEKSWMDALKEASGTAFLGTLLRWLARTFADACYPTRQLHQRLYVHNVFMLTMIPDNMKQSNSVLMTFFLMMVVNQRAQERAQAEIDVVVGEDRLPTMDDRPLLPYLDAIFRETLRYSPVAPLCERFRPLVRPCSCC